MMDDDADAATVGGWPLLDERVLGLLAKDLGEDSANDVVRLFLTGAPRMIDRLERSFASPGWVLLRIGCAAADIEQTFADAEPGEDQLVGLLSLLRQSATRLAEWQATRQTTATDVTCRQ